MENKNYWFACKSSKIDKYFYFNKMTNESVWALPKGAKLNNEPINKLQVKSDAMSTSNSPEAHLHLNRPPVAAEFKTPKTVTSKDLQAKKVFKTPIQDRQDTKKEELLKRHQLIEPTTSTNPQAKSQTPFQEQHNKKIEKNIRKNKLIESVMSAKRKYKTPIQDRFNKKREELMKSQQSIDSVSPPNSNGHVKKMPRTEAALVVRRLPIKNPANQFHTLKTNQTIQNSTQIKDNGIGNTFDLRSKLNKRKRESSSSISSDSPMDCDSIPENEDYINTTQESSKRMKISPPSGLHTSGRNTNKQIYLVCDTNALIDDPDLVERLVTRGEVNGMRVNIVVPTIVVTELNGLKHTSQDNSDTSRSFLIRKASRLLNNLEDRFENFRMQDGSIANQPTKSLKIESNDDLVLNCGLQVQNDCNDSGDHVFLITNDILLQLKATSFKLKSFKWEKYKLWAREQKFGSPPTIKPIASRKKDISDIEQMEVDPSSASTQQMNAASITYAESETSEKSQHFQNCCKSYLEEAKVHLQTYLHEVLTELQDSLYDPELRKYANQIRPSWTLRDYLYNIKSRWQSLTMSAPSKQFETVIQKLNDFIIRSNSDHNLFAKSDVEEFFKLCRELCSEINSKSSKYSTSFLDKLESIHNEWKNDDSQNITNDSFVSSDDGEEELSKAGVAVESIFSNLNQRFKAYYGVDNIEDTGPTYDIVCDFQSCLESILKEQVNNLNPTNKHIKSLEDLINNYDSGSGQPYSFEDLNISTIIELFQDASCRKFAESLKSNFDQLVDDMLTYILQRQSKKIKAILPGER